ncbi:site-specific integrase [Marinactinospora thermotolerans]|nr:site-specific integrase [Marinactinospora thermotolerans]
MDAGLETAIARLRGLIAHELQREFPGATVCPLPKGGWAAVYHGTPVTAGDAVMLRAQLAAMNSSSMEVLGLRYVLALCLGLRRGELLGLRWRDVNLETGRLEVVDTLQRVGGRLLLVPPKTEDSARTVPLPSLCVAALWEHRKRQLAERSAAGPAWRDHDLVFPSRRGTPLEPGNLRRSWHPLRSAAGLDGVRFHDLRHTCVTLLLNLETPPQVVREIVGHSDIGVTMTIYAHASLDDRRRALRRLGDALG